MYSDWITYSKLMAIQSLYITPKCHYVNLLLSTTAFLCWSSGAPVSFWALERSNFQFGADMILGDWILIRTRIKIKNRKTENWNENENRNETGEDTYAGALCAPRAGSPAFVSVFVRFNFWFFKFLFLYVYVLIQSPSTQGRLLKMSILQCWWILAMSIKSRDSLSFVWMA